jgi:exopolyphosphatase/guanosine-5'-triphosphate,3'-diphosphate pyrophosphatase
MVEIIPRWEWRTFARTIETRIDLAAYPRTRHVESSEIYLASATSEGNPKIRDEKIDIKTLQLANDDGLEQWKPVLKASFPLSVDQLAEVYRALNLAAPPGVGPFGLEALLQMVNEDTRSWAVFVDKVRNQYNVDGCIVEASQVTFDGEAFQTVAAEDPDAVKVRNTVAKLGLLEQENISYVKAIHRIKSGRL